MLLGLFPNSSDQEEVKALRLKPQKGGVVPLKIKVKHGGRKGQGPMIYQLIAIRMRPVEPDFIPFISQIPGVTKVEVTARKLMIWHDLSISWRRVRSDLYKLLSEHYQTQIR